MLVTARYTEPEGGKRVFSKTICTGDTTLYAHWRRVFCGITWDVYADSLAKGRLTVEWSTILTQVNGYEIAISSDRKNWTVSAAPMSRKRTLYGLKSGKTYYVRIRGWRYDSTGKRIYGAWSKTVSERIR